MIGGFSPIAVTDHFGKDQAVKVGAGAGPMSMVPNMVEQVLAPERGIMDAARGRRDRVIKEKNEYSALHGLLGELDAATSKMSTMSQFTKLKIDSSHPDILEGIATGAAMPGSYEFEIRGMASQDRHLEMGFPDRDQTPVGFGFMAVEVGGVSQDVIISPGSTLNDVVQQINDASPAVKAQIVNTGYADDPLRLLVSSVDTGEAAKISLDEDTTFLDFKTIKSAANLDARFEDVPVTSKENALGDLLEGVTLKAKRAEPGTKVQVNVQHDMDLTLTGIKSFTDSYNKIMGFAGEQYQKDPETGRLGNMAGGASLRTVMRTLQSEVAGAKSPGSSFGSLAEVGISTDYKTGALRLDEQKLKKAITTDYQAVAQLFAFSENGKGVANRLHDAIKAMRDPESGVLTTRVKGLATMIRDQEKSIARQEDRLAQKKETLTHQFGQMGAKIATMESQNHALSARFGDAQQEEASP